MQLKSGVSTNSVLTDLQKKVLLHFSQNEFISKNFYLTGGTALSAFYLQHRYSDDLDFFTHHQSLKDIHLILTSIFKDASMSYKPLEATPSFHRYLVENELKLDFVLDIPERIGNPIVTDNILIDDLSNIATNKVCTILGRLDAKDYVDLYFILKKTDLKLEQLIHWAKLKDRGMELFIWANLLGDVQTFQALPKMIVPLTLKELLSFYLNLRDKLLLQLKPAK